MKINDSKNKAAFSIFVKVSTVAFFAMLIISTIATILLVMAFVTTMATSSSVPTYQNVDGTVRDKYVSNHKVYLVVDHEGGSKTEAWSVYPESYEACEIGDNINRAEKGDINCVSPTSKLND